MQTFTISLARSRSCLLFRSINPLQVLARLFQIQFLKVLAYLLSDILVNSLIIWTRRFGDSFHLVFFILSSKVPHVLGLIQECEAHAVVAAAYAFHKGGLLPELLLG